MSNINEHVYVIPGVTEVTKPNINREFSNCLAVSCISIEVSKMAHG
jgi:hypothetical protein